MAPDAWIAPTAVLSGQVRVGSGSCVLHGAVLTDDGGPVEVGANCVIMEHAVVRGTPRHPVRIGDHVLAGPHCYLTGCTISDEVFSSEADSIRAGLEETGGFMPFVFGTDGAADRGEQMRTAMRRYARSLSRSHRDDEDTQ